MDPDGLPRKKSPTSILDRTKSLLHTHSVTYSPRSIRIHRAGFNPRMEKRNYIVRCNKGFYLQHNSRASDDILGYLCKGSVDPNLWFSCTASFYYMVLIYMGSTRRQQLEIIPRLNCNLFACRNGQTKQYFGHHSVPQRTVKKRGNKASLGTAVVSPEFFLGKSRPFGEKGRVDFLISDKLWGIEA